MKTLLVICAALSCIGCRTYQGGMAEDVESEYVPPTLEWTDARGMRTLPPGRAFDRSAPGAYRAQQLE